MPGIRSPTPDFPNDHPTPLYDILSILQTSPPEPLNSTVRGPFVEAGSPNGPRWPKDARVPYMTCAMPVCPETRALIQSPKALYLACCAS